MTKTIALKSLLDHADLTVPPLHIPDGEGGCYKTELVIERSEERVVKINWWHAPDPRRDPHNHPWEFFNSTILSGGYTETRYRARDNMHDAERRTYRVGDINSVPHDVFHTVDEVLPGTVTRMECGPLVKDGEWGYIDKNGTYSPAEASEEFLKNLCEINPHKRR